MREPKDAMSYAGSSSELRIQHADELRNWLGEHHEAETGIWVVSYKKGHQHHVPYGDICFAATRREWLVG